MKKTIITGVTGQTGSWLAENLLNEGHKVYGLMRRSSHFNDNNIKGIMSNPNLDLSYGDLTDSSSINKLVNEIKPDYFYNLGAMSFVKASFDIPEYTFDVDAAGVIRVLEAIRNFSPKTRFLQASTSELYGNSPPPQSELTPFEPRSPYGVAKLAAYWAVKNYREAYKLFACNAISFNHEGTRRSEHFITRKVTRAACRISVGLQDKLVLGNLASKRDFLDARDVCKGQQIILEAEKADDFVIASGVAISMQQFVEKVFSKLNLDHSKYVEISEKYFRPTEVDHLCGDPSKIKSVLGWEQLISFDQMVDDMVNHDLELAKKEL